MPWEMSILSAHLPFNIIETHQDGFNGKPWDMFSLSTSKDLSFEFVQKYPAGLNGMV